MSTKIRIAVDAMSGDLGPRVVIAAAIQAVATFPELELALVGDQDQLQLLLATAQEANNPRLMIVHAIDIVAMDEDPINALRHKRQSSMWRALALVEEGVADACVSAGNTGALLAISKYLIKTFPGVDRPAICKSMPVEQGQTYMLDLGANLSCSAEQLHQFALMGNILACDGDARNARIALLNVGVEKTKGTPVITACHEMLLADSRLNYIGFIEGDAIYTGQADVIVSDGFSGNIALKSSEGVARLIMKKIEIIFSQHWYLKLLAFFLRSTLRQLRTELNPSAYNGASFLGLRKTVVKSHGGANQQAFFHALEFAKNQVLQKVPERIQQHLRVEC